VPGLSCQILTKQALKTYFEVPVDILEDAEQFTQWTHQACRIATF
jgi:hypothetical protein